MASVAALRAAQLRDTARNRIRVYRTKLPVIATWISAISSCEPASAGLEESGTTLCLKRSADTSIGSFTPGQNMSHYVARSALATSRPPLSLPLRSPLIRRPSRLPGIGASCRATSKRAPGEAADRAVGSSSAATDAEIDALAARHGARLKKRLQFGGGARGDRRAARRRCGQIPAVAHISGDARVYADDGGHDAGDRRRPGVGRARRGCPASPAAASASR